MNEREKKEKKVAVPHFQRTLISKWKGERERERKKDGMNSIKTPIYLLPKSFVVSC